MEQPFVSPHVHWKHGPFQIRVVATQCAARERQGDHRAAFLAAASLRRAMSNRYWRSLSRRKAYWAVPVLAVVTQMENDTNGSTLIGRHLGLYQVLAPLGAGGMGEVYRARDTRLGREVAIKVLPREFTADPERLARFEREARVLAALNHPHIAAIYEVEQFDGTDALGRRVRDVAVVLRQPLRLSTRCGNAP
jgi:hypothetical protein